MLSTKRLTCLSFLAVLASGCHDGAAQRRDDDGFDSELAQATNSFGFDLLRQVQAQAGAGENILVSPLSVATALGMVYNGAAGSTQAAMRETLQLGELSVDDVNDGYRRLAGRLVDLDPVVEFLTANSIWYVRGFDVKQGFLDVTGEYFAAEVAAIDFASPSAAPTINGWVDNATRGRIEDIVDDPLDPEALMYLINAVYFKGDWTIQFDPDLTVDRLFYLADGSVKQVPMMTYPGPLEIRHFSDADVQAIDLPYGGDQYSMTIMMPPAGDDIDALAQSLDAERWHDIVNGLARTRTNVLMPKLTLEYDLEMSDALKAMGMNVAFSHAADFSEICDGGLVISEVKHKTFIDVNEQGTEAAAATAVELKRGPPPAVFSVDRPFVFAIRERVSGTIVFAGRVMDPTLTS
jgi:serpin B